MAPCPVPLAFAENRPGREATTGMFNGAERVPPDSTISCVVADPEA